MMKVNEIFCSIQGEGALIGEPTIFIRFSGCNLSCSFCDTNHESSTPMEAPEIIKRVESLHVFRNRGVSGSVTLTGGEPLMVQEIEVLILLLVGKGFKVRVETNGTFPLDDALRGLTSEQLYITCSPKTSIETIKVQRINCIKLLFPYLEEVSPFEFSELKDARLQRAVKVIQPIYPTAEDLTQDQIRVEYGWACGVAILEASVISGWMMIPQVHKLINVR